MRARRFGTFVRRPFEALEDRRLLAAAPVAVDDKYTVLAGEMLVSEPGVLANDYDADGDELSVLLVAAPRHGAVALAPDGGFRYLPNRGFVGEDSFVYRAYAGGEASQPATVLVTTKASSNFDIWSREFGGNGKAYAVVGERLPWADARDAASFVEFDGVGSHLATITSQAEADAILRLRASQSNAWLGGYQDRTAPDFAEPAGGWRWITGEPFDYDQWMPGEPNNWVGAGDEDFLETLGWGETTFWWNDVADLAGYGGYSVETTEAVTPFAGDDLFQVAVGLPRSVEAAGYLFNDRYGRATVTFDIVSAPAHGTVVVQADGSITYTPAPDFTGLDVVAYRLHTADGASNAARIVFKVGLDEYPLEISIRNYSTFEDYPITTGNGAWPSLLANAYDGDSTQLRAELATPPQHGQLQLNWNGQFIYTPDPDYFGPDEFGFVVVDGPVRSAEKKVSLSMTFVNDPPQAMPDHYELLGSGPQVVAAEIGLLVNDSDPDFPLLSTELVASPGQGLVQLLSDGGFTYAPKPGFRGIDRFTYRAFDLFEYSPETDVLIAVDALFGDANLDGRVDLGDFGALKAHFGAKNATLAQGDLDGDADVDLADFGLLKQNFGRTSVVAEIGVPGALAVAPQATAAVDVRDLGWLRWAWDQRNGKPEGDGDR
ncbi:MAG: Ig-like domain-containing protein [Pirellulales bacterium]